MNNSGEKSGEVWKYGDYKVVRSLKNPNYLKLICNNKDTDFEDYVMCTYRNVKYELNSLFDDIADYCGYEEPSKPKPIKKKIMETEELQKREDERFERAERRHEETLKRYEDNLNRYKSFKDNFYNAVAQTGIKYIEEDYE